MIVDGYSIMLFEQSEKGRIEMHIPIYTNSLAMIVDQRVEGTNITVNYERPT